MAFSLAPLMAAVDLSPVVTGVIAVAALVVAVLVAIRATRFIYEVVGGESLRDETNRLEDEHERIDDDE